MRVRVLAALALLFLASAVRAEEPFAQWVARFKQRSVAVQNGLSISARATSVSGEPALHFIITNNSAAPLTFSTDALPWGNTYSLNVLALTGKAQLLAPRYPVEDPVVGEVVVPSNGKLEGEYVLSRALQGIRPALAASDLVVVWSYGSFNGVVVFPRR